MSNQRSQDVVQIANTLVKSIAMVALVIVVAYKIITTPFDLQIDFSALLSLLLALFSIGLGAMFYFKATDTSNTFYDNTYKFTRDIADLLVRIESGFGERLRHLDESYARIQARFESPFSPEELRETQEELKEGEQLFEEKLRERDKLVEDLIAKAKLDDREKESFVRQLDEKDGELKEAQSEIEFHKRQIVRLRSRPDERDGDSRRESVVRNFTRRSVLPELDTEYVARAPMSLLNRRWKEVSKGQPRGFLEDMRRIGYLRADGLLTREGFEFIRALAREEL